MLCINILHKNIVHGYTQFLSLTILLPMIKSITNSLCKKED